MLGFPEGKRPATTAETRGEAKAWVKFNGTANSRTITNTVNTGTDELTVTSHALSAATPGDVDTVPAVSVRNSGGALPGGLAANTIYYARVVDANTLTLHTGRLGALSNFDRVDLTSNGTGTNVLDYINIYKRYAVGGVIQVSSAGALTAASYEVYWASAFATADYVISGTARNVAGGIVMFISSADASLTDRKRIVTQDLAAAASESGEVHVVAFGLLP